MKKFIRIKISEASGIAGPCPETIKGWIREGYVRGYRTPGGSWYVLLESLLDYIKKLEKEAVTKPNSEKLSKEFGRLKMVLEC